MTVAEGMHGIIIDFLTPEDESGADVASPLYETLAGYYLPVGDHRFTSGAQLSTANFEAAMGEAIDEAYARGQNATILIPPGVWPISTGFHFPYAVNPNGQRITLQGAGSQATVFEVDADFLGQVFDINGLKEVLVDAGYITLTFRGFSVRGPTAGGCAGTGIRVQMAFMPQFDDVYVTDFGGQVTHEDPDTHVVTVIQEGKCWEFRQQTGAFNTQDLMMTNCAAMRGRIGMVLDGILHFEIRGMLLNQNVKNHVVYVSNLEGCFTSPLIQGGTTGPAFTTVAGSSGGIRVSVKLKAYNESGAQPILKAHAPTTSYNAFVFEGLSINGPTTLFDVDTCNLTVTDLRSVLGFTKLVKARNSIVDLQGPYNPNTHPQYFDLDQYSAQHMTVLGNGRIWVGAQSFDCYDARSTALPFLREVWDLRDTALSTIVSGKLTQQLGSLRGDVAAAETGFAPVYSASTAAFNNKPTIETTIADKTGLTATLSLPIAVGCWAGLFYIAAKTSAPSGHCRISVNDGAVNETGANNGIFCGIGDDLFTGGALADKAGWFSYRAGDLSSNGSGPDCSTNTHVVLAQFTLAEGSFLPYASQFVDHTEALNFWAVDPPATALTRVSIPQHIVSGYGADMKIAMVGVLWRGMPLPVARQFMKYACAEFGV